MGSIVGLTVAQTSKLLELGKKHGRIPMVRIFSKNGEQHAQRAMLLGLNGQKAIVKPVAHKRNEEVDVALLRFWKAGNPFDISESEEMVEPLDIDLETIFPEKQRVLLYCEELGSYWCGQARQWNGSPMTAIEYILGSEIEAQQYILKKYKTTTTVVPLEDARYNWMQSRKQWLSPTPIQDTRLLLEAERRQLVLSYQEISAKLLEVDNKIKELGGQKAVTQASRPAPNTTTTRTHIRQDVLDILRSYPGSTLETIHSKLLLRKSNCPLDKVKICLLNMKNVGMVVRTGDRWNFRA